MPQPDTRADGKHRVRCHACKRTLAYASPDAVREGGEIEIKCKDCNELNYLVGQALKEAA